MKVDFIICLLILILLLFFTSEYYALSTLPEGVKHRIRIELIEHYRKYMMLRDTRATFFPHFPRPSNCNEVVFPELRFRKDDIVVSNLIKLTAFL